MSRNKRVIAALLMAVLICPAALASEVDVVSDAVSATTTVFGSARTVRRSFHRRNMAPLSIMSFSTRWKP